MEMKRKANGKEARGTYISHRIQNELIDLIGKFLEQCVIDRGTVKQGILPLVSSLEKLVDEGDEKAPGLLVCTLQFSFWWHLWLLQVFFLLQLFCLENFSMSPLTSMMLLNIVKPH